jgi:hypothetical protein
MESGSCETTAGDFMLRYGKGALSSPLRATIGTLGQGQITAASWQVMKRRTSNLLYPPDQFEMCDGQQPCYPGLTNNLAAGLFFASLLQRVEQRTNYQYQITFVGHSMGTMVLNQLFNVHRRAWITSRSIENIIYMGAACSVTECLQAMAPLLQGYEAAKADPMPRFYNLTLHPLAEIAEEMFWPVVPAGSLLHLIDTHLQSPNTPLDRTMGSQVNVLSTLEIFSDIKAYCTFKGFDFRPGALPAKHGDFSNCPFWRSDFRTAQPSGPIKAHHANRYADPKFLQQPTSRENTYPPNWLEEYK